MVTDSAGTADRRACSQVESRTNLAELSGARIAAIDVTAGAPRPARFAWLARLAGRAHVRTQQRTVRRFLLLAPGDTVDTLRVAESLRRLRRLRYLDDVVLIGTRCGADSALTLTVATRDVMSFRPEARLTTSGAAPRGAGGTPGPSRNGYSVGFEERNLFGTGRELRANAVGLARRNGFAVSALDPTLLGTFYTARVRLARNPLENATGFAIRPPDREVAARWRGEVSVNSVTRAGIAARGASFARSGGQGLVGYRLAADDGRGAATYVLAGAEAERTRLIAAPHADLAGPARVRRDFAGVDVGLVRFAKQFTEITWLLPGARVVDAPQGFEGELVAGLGREGVSKKPASHVDFWSGRMWAPGDRALVVSDVWGTGYLRPGSFTGGSVRVALTSVTRAGGGYWYNRLAAERLSAPDPDQQALLGIDPTLQMLPRRTRLAQMAVAGLVERDWRVPSRVGRIALDLAAFGAGSYRTSERTTGPDVNEFATAVGAGLHLVPPSVGRTAFRVDYVVPVTPAAHGRKTPYITASVTPWLLGNRSRDGRR